MDRQGANPEDSFPYVLIISYSVCWQNDFIFINRKICKVYSAILLDDIVMFAIKNLTEIFAYIETKYYIHLLMWAETMTSK